MLAAAFQPLCTQEELAPAPASLLQPWGHLQAPADVERDKHAVTSP